MALELVNSATSEKLAEVDWAKNIDICELVACDQSRAKYVIKAIKKRLGGKSTNAQLLAFTLLEMLMNNIGDAVHKQVIEAGLLPILVKIVKKKSDLPVREKIFFLLDATQTAFGGASGKFPQYYTAYYELVSAGVKFPQRAHAVSSNHPSSGENKNNLSVANVASAKEERATSGEDSQPPGSSIIEKVNATMEVLREVLDSVDAQNPQAAKDEFTLDLVEQCSFQKDRVMHLVMTCRDDRLVSQAIELNEQLGQALARHEALVSHRFLSTESPQEHHDGSPLTSNHINHKGQELSSSNLINNVGQPTMASNHITHIDHEETDEEEEEQLCHRTRKGKAHMRPEDEDGSVQIPSGSSLSSSNSTEQLHPPLIRSLKHEPHSDEIKVPPLATSIPPPPAKRVERERFFQEKRGDGTALAGHMRGLSLHSRNASSSSYTGSLSSNE